MQQHCQQQPENHFYQAALLLLEASQKHILRYAELAETMAANCTDAQRREELLTIAEISRHNAQHKPQTFWQACQLFWYMNIILQYESNASSLSLGRFDQYMLPFYQTSLTQWRRCGVPERTARIFMGEMQRHRAVALHQQRALFRRFPDRLYRTARRVNRERT